MTRCIPKPLPICEYTQPSLILLILTLYIVTLRVRLAPWNRFKPSSKIFFRPFQGGTSSVDPLFFSVLCLLCLCARLFICALWSPAWKGLTSWLLFVASNCEFVTYPLVSWVRCGTWLYRFLIFAPLLTLKSSTSSILKSAFALNNSHQYLDHVASTATRARCGRALSFW